MWLFLTVWSQVFYANVLNLNTLCTHTASNPRKLSLLALKAWYRLALQAPPQGLKVIMYNYEQINVGEEFSCSLEPGSSHSPSDNATTASALNEKLQKKKGLKHERLLVLASTKQGQCELYCLKSNEWPKPHHWHNTCFWKKNLEPDSEAQNPNAVV